MSSGDFRFLTQKETDFFSKKVHHLWLPHMSLKNASICDLTPLTSKACKIKLKLCLHSLTLFFLNFCSFLKDRFHSEDASCQKLVRTDLCMTLN